MMKKHVTDILLILLILVISAAVRACNHAKRYVRKKGGPKKFAARTVLNLLAIGAVTVLVLPFAARYGMHAAAKSRVYTDVEKAPECRVAMVLGATVYPNGQLSICLRDRVNTAIALYKAGKVEKILMSGDNSSIHYDEPTHMAEYAISRGVPAEDVVMDFAGRRTYDSVYRAKHIFGQDKLIVVTQSFHLDRALFLCRAHGIDAWGVSADVENHDNSNPALREYPACVSALLDVLILRPKPIMGEEERI